MMYDMYTIDVKFIPVSKAALIEQALQFKHNTSGFDLFDEKLTLQ